jgi:hypothetical protein
MCVGSPLASAELVRMVHIAAVKVSSQPRAQLTQRSPPRELVQVTHSAPRVAGQVEELYTQLNAALEAAEAQRNPEQKRRREGIGGPRPAPAAPGGVRVPKPASGFTVGAA